MAGDLGAPLADLNHLVRSASILKRVPTDWQLLTDYHYKASMVKLIDALLSTKYLSLNYLSSDRLTSDCGRRFALLLIEVRTCCWPACHKGQRASSYLHYIKESHE